MIASDGEAASHSIRLDKFLFHQKTSVFRVPQKFGFCGMYTVYSKIHKQPALDPHTLNDFPLCDSSCFLYVFSFKGTMSVRRDEQTSSSSPPRRRLPPRRHQLCLIALTHALLIFLSANDAASIELFYNDMMCDEPRDDVVFENEEFQRGEV